MFLIFPFFVFSIIPFKVLTPANWNKTINGNIPTLVRFYSLHRKYSLQLDEQYDLVAEIFQGIEGIVVSGINCGKYRHFCYEHGVSMTPVVKLFTKDAVHIYDGGMSHESISRWATTITGVHGREVAETMRRPNGRVFKEILNETHCVFTMFYNPSCAACIKFLPAMQEVAEAFKYDSRVAIVANDVDLYKFYHWDYDLKRFPDLRLYCKDEKEPIDFIGRRTAEDLIDFINDYCGTSRGLDGRLNSEAGVIDDVSSIVEDFMRKGMNDRYIKDMSDFGGNTQYYVWVMKAIIDKGPNIIYEERNRLRQLLDSNTLSPEKIDEFQIRVNILSVFASYVAED